MLGRDYSGTDLRWTAQDAPRPTARSRSSPASPTTRSTSTAAASRTSSARRSACRARCAATRTTTSPTSTSTCRARGSSRRRWTLHAGVRHSKRALLVRGPLHRRPEPRRQRQRRLRRDAAGRRRCCSRRRRRVHLYATAGRGFETPTLNELAYRPSGPTGLNLALGAGQERQLRGRRQDAHRLGRRQRRAVRDAHRATRSPRSDQRRRPLDVPERRLDAAARARGGVERRPAREPARAGRLHLARRALPRRLPDLHGDAVPGAEPHHPGRQPHPGHRARLALRRARLGAAARLARRRRGAGAEQGLGQRRQLRRRGRLRDRQRQRRLRRARRRAST